MSITQLAGERPKINTLQQSNISNVTKTGAAVTFSYSSLFAVTEYGVCYSSTKEMPTTDDEHLQNSGNEMQGSATFQLNNLESGKTYYLRAYARSAVGIQYSNSLSFSTQSSQPATGDNVIPQL